ncbi:MAG: hypothetical protein FD166_221 [Bacteroidetes bacterium]|nr:MAG: hypothetical protein FD166_221 [Bacteroidota bacterium]
MLRTHPSIKRAESLLMTIDQDKTLMMDLMFNRGRIHKELLVDLSC